jgi:hypothetical protein
MLAGSPGYVAEGWRISALIPEFIKRRKMTAIFIGELVYSVFVTNFI